MVGTGLAFGLVNAGMAYMTGGNVGAAFIGGFVEGALISSGIGAVYAGAAGGFTQGYIESGGDLGAATESGVIGGVTSGIPLPGAGRAGKTLVREGGMEVEQAATKREIEALLPEGYEKAAREISDKGMYDRLMSMPLRQRNAQIGNIMHDAMGGLVEQKNLATYTIRGKGGPDFKCDGYWFDLSTHNTWHGKINKYKADFTDNGKPIYYDPGEVLNCYQKMYRP